MKFRRCVQNIKDFVFAYSLKGKIIYDSSASIENRLHNNALKDFISISILSVITFAISIKYDIFEILTEYSQKYEKYEIDELIVLACILFIAFTAYSYRRIADLQIAFVCLRKISETDDLTGVCSRRRIFELIYQEFECYKRHKHPFCLLLIDIDSFKGINDSYGHITGDKVLQNVAGLMTDLSRKTDRVGRIGGDEFLILLPETDMNQAVNAANRLREKTASLSIEYGGHTIRISLSIGVTDIKENIESTEHLISIADRLLYDAKSQGKNFVSGA